MKDVSACYEDAFDSRTQCGSFRLNIKLHVKLTIFSIILFLVSKFYALNFPVVQLVIAVIFLFCYHGIEVLGLTAFWFHFQWSEKKLHNKRL